MDNRLKLDALIEDALNSQPLAPMPRSITADVMARIQKDQRPAILTWNDFVLSGVIAACLAALWFALQNLPPIMNYDYETPYSKHFAISGFSGECALAGAKSVIWHGGVACGVDNSYTDLDDDQTTVNKPCKFSNLRSPISAKYD